MPSDGQLQLGIVEDKPPFRIPTMAEVSTVEPNGLEIVSFFSGCGGSCLGFRMAGYRTLYASEFVPAAAETYRANHPDVLLDERDIREVDPAEVLERIERLPGEVDVIEGSPPCSSFSMAGKRQEGWGKVKKYSDVEQRTDDLFDEYVRMIAGIRPRAFVAENVPGLVTGDPLREEDAPVEYVQSITRQLGALGYSVEGQILNAAHYGVPQSRRRLILIGVRRDVGRPSWPSRLPYTYSVRDALPDLEAVQSLYGFDGHAFYSSDRPAETIPQRPGGTKLVEVKLVGGVGSTIARRDQEFDLDEPLPTVLAGGGDRKRTDQFSVEVRRVLGSEVVGEDVAPSLEEYAIGDALDEMNGSEKSERYFSLVRPNLDRPLPTVTQTGGNIGAASVVHPTEKRKFTMRELKALCGFPDDFVLTGSYSQQWERLGRAVPPLMMAAVARAIRDDVL